MRFFRILIPCGRFNVALPEGVVVSIAFYFALSLSAEPT